MKILLAQSLFSTEFGSYVQPLGAIIMTLLIVLMVGAPFIRMLQAKSVQESIRSDGPTTHYIKAGTPTMGGVFLIGAMVVSLLIWGDYSSITTLVAIASLVLFAGIGCIDDLRKLRQKGKDGISVKQKLVLQAIASLAVVGLFYLPGSPAVDTAIYLPFSQDRVLFDLGVGYFPLMVLFMVFMSNAVNLTDGLDGLATGLAIPVAIAALLLGLFSITPGGGNAVILPAVMLGGLLGFLWYNRNPARVFMGDTGSLALGAYIAVLGMVTKQEIIILLVSSIFVLDALSVMIQVGWYKRTKKRVFLMAPVHHHFEKKGWAERKVVKRFWLAGWSLMGVISIGIVAWGSGIV